MASKSANGKQVATTHGHDEEAGQQVALYGSAANLPAEVAGELEGLTDLGYSQKAEDSLIPVLNILHDNSAEVKTRHERYIQGAKPGDFIIRALNMVIDPMETPVIVQTAAFIHVWVEWQGEAGEGTPVNRYPFDDRPAEAEEVTDPQNDEKTYWAMPNGNRLVDTREHYAFVLIGNAWMPVVIPMHGTNHKPSRGWTNLMKTFQLGSGQQAPAWFRFYRFYSKYQSRGTQTWFIYDIKDQGWVADANLRAAGRKLNESVIHNELTPDLDHEKTGDQPETGDAKVAAAAAKGKTKSGKEIPI